MTSNRHKHGSQAGDSYDTDEGGGRHLAAVETLHAAVEPLVEDLGYELLLLEWLGAGKRRLMRLYIDSPNGVTVEDCTRLGRILGNALDAREAQAAGGPSEGGASEGGHVHDPVLAALLGKPYTLEISSPGVDRPLTRRRHFEAQVGGKVKIETFAPLVPGVSEKKFYGRIIAVEPDPNSETNSEANSEANSEDPGDQRRGVVVVHDPEGDRTLRIPLPRIRRANLVWEG
jgi:ribosome maturation factor RimP